MDDGRVQRKRDGEAGATWFLPPDRAPADLLTRQFAVALHSPVVDTLLRNWAGAIAVLNAERQVIAINADYLALLGVDDAAGVLGLRPGEAIGCAHARENLPGGCGTSRACATCGAALSILAVLEQGGAAERDCCLTLDRGGVRTDVDFRVRAHELELDFERYVLLSLTDVSLDRRRAALERAFFHDLANLVMGVVGACEAMEGASPGEMAAAAADAREMGGQIVQELKLQRALASPLPSDYRTAVRTVALDELLATLRKLFQRHPVAAGRRLDVVGDPDGARIETDPSLLLRVVTNMLVNAFEASPAGAVVRLTVELGPERVAFRVWNAGAIPAAVAPRIFQRYFSTKGSDGRGQGTFVMKHFGEQWLRGRVGFTSTPEDGTTFELSIPRSLPA